MNFTEKRSLAAPRKKRMIRCIRDLLFLASVIALSYVGFTLFQARQFQSAANQALVARIRATQDRNSLRPSLPIHKGDVLGRIDIPRLGLSVAVLQGTNAQILRLGAGHIEGTPLPGEPGNSGVAGHRDTFFRSLKDVHKDDQIDIQTPTGLLRYEVDWVKVVAPNDTSVLQSSGKESTLTLVTCYPFYLVGPAPKRYVVHATKAN
jgi:sortase A